MSSAVSPPARPTALRVGDDGQRLAGLMRRLQSEPDPFSPGPAPGFGGTLSRARGVKRPPESEVEPAGSNSEGAAGGSQADSTLDRAKKLQEKNARAQKKYRQRQREKLDGLVQQAESLGKENQELRGEVEELRRQNASLLQQASNRNYPSTSGVQAAAPVPRLPSPTPLVAPELPAHKKAWPLPCGDKKQDCPHLLSHIIKVCANKRIAGRALQEMGDPSTSLGVLTASEWFSVYKSFTGELAMLLAESDQDTSPQSKALKQITEIVTEKRTLGHVAMTPQRLEAKTLIHTEPIRLVGPPPANMWNQVAKQIRLEPWQVQQLLELRQGFQGQLQELISRRRLIINELHACVPDCHDGTHGGTTTAKAFAASKQLCDSIQQEQVIVMEFLQKMNHEVLTPIQEARVGVASYPWFPDSLAICNAIASQEVALPGMPGLSNFSRNGTSTATATAEPQLPDLGANSLKLPDSLGSDSRKPDRSLFSPEGSPQQESWSLAASQPLMLDSAWIAGLPDIPLLPEVFGDM